MRCEGTPSSPDAMRGVAPKHRNIGSGGNRFLQPRY